MNTIESDTSGLLDTDDDTLDDPDTVTDPDSRDDMDCDADTVIDSVTCLVTIGDSEYVPEGVDDTDTVDDTLFVVVADAQIVLDRVTTPVGDACVPLTRGDFDTLGEPVTVRETRGDTDEVVLLVPLAVTVEDAVTQTVTIPVRVLIADRVIDFEVRGVKENDGLDVEDCDVLPDFETEGDAVLDNECDVETVTVLLTEMLPETVTLRDVRLDDDGVVDTVDDVELSRDAETDAVVRIEALFDDETDGDFELVDERDELADEVIVFDDVALLDTLADADGDFVSSPVVVLVKLAERDATFVTENIDGVAHDEALTVDVGEDVIENCDADMIGDAVLVLLELGEADVVVVTPSDLVRRGELLTDTLADVVFDDDVDAVLVIVKNALFDVVVDADALLVDVWLAETVPDSMFVALVAAEAVVSAVAELVLLDDADELTENDVIPVLVSDAKPDVEKDVRGDDDTDGDTLDEPDGRAEKDKVTDAEKQPDAEEVFVLVCDADTVTDADCVLLELAEPDTDAVTRVDAEFVDETDTEGVSDDEPENFGLVDVVVDADAVFVLVIELDGQCDTLTEVVVDWLTLGDREVRGELDPDAVGRGVADTVTLPESLGDSDDVLVVETDGESAADPVPHDELSGDLELESDADGDPDRVSVKAGVRVPPTFVTDTSALHDTEGVLESSPVEDAVADAEKELRALGLDDDDCDGDLLPRDVGDVLGVTEMVFVDVLDGAIVAEIAALRVVEFDASGVREADTDFVDVVDAVCVRVLTPLTEDRPDADGDFDEVDERDVVDVDDTELVMVSERLPRDEGDGEFVTDTVGTVVRDTRGLPETAADAEYVFELVVVLVDD